MDKILDNLVISAPYLDIKQDFLDFIAPEAERIVFDFTQNIGEQINRLLADYTEIDRLHIFLDSQSDSLFLNSEWLNQKQSQQLNQFLSNNTTLLFYRYQEKTGNFHLTNQLLLNNLSLLETAEQVLDASATVTTDLDDYPPGATAIIIGQNFEPGETIELQVLHTDATPNTGGGHEPWQVTDGGEGDLDGKVDGNFETTWYVNPDDSANSTFKLTATGLTSGDVATHHFTDSDPAVQFFYIPKKEEDIRTGLYRVNPAFGLTVDIQTLVSITVSTDDSIIYYDHWEDDGYESDISNPTQSTTEIWGDNDPDNGIAPGYTTDVLNAGDIISLENSVDVANTATVFDFDGEDKIGASKAIVVSRPYYPDAANGELIAEEVNVYDTSKWGTSYEIPLGEDFTSSVNFQYTSLFVTAAEDNTTLTITGADTTGDNIADSPIVTTIDEGESYFLDGGVLVGTEVTASTPIQAHLLTGDIGSNYATRAYTLVPTADWGISYYTPVGTVVSGKETDVFLYNPDTSGSITVNYETQGSSGTVSVPAGTVVRQTLPVDADSGAHFYTTNSNDIFFATTAFDSEDSAHDWGFSLIPEANLTPIIQVGWGPGNGNKDQNGNPLWVMATAATTIYVDYDGDGVAPNTDINGTQYDESFSIGALESIQITDTKNNDFDQSGIRVYTVDGTNLAGAWGQDANAATAGTSLDLGTEILPLPIAYSWKEFDLVNDVNGDGNVDPGDTLEFTINIKNEGVVVLGNVNVSDIVPDGTTYVPGTTTINGVAVGDDTAGTAFTLNDDNIANGIDAGKNIGNIPVGESAVVTVQMLVNDPYDGDLGGITNSAAVDSDEDTLTVAVNVPVDQSGVKTKTLYLSDNSGSNNLDRVDPDSGNETTDSSISVFPGTTINVRDEFNSVSYSNNNGSNNWKAAWDDQANNADQDPDDGRIKVNSNQLRLRNLNPNEYVQRSMDLSGTTSAALSFDWSTDSLDSADGEAVRVSISTSANGTFIPLFTATDTNSGTQSNIDISSYIAADTTIRFDSDNGADWNQNNGDNSNDTAFFDNIEIDASSSTNTFTQSIPMRSDFDMSSGQDIVVTAYINVSTGTPSTTSDITASLTYDSGTLLNLSNPTSVTSESGNIYKVTWEATLGSNTTIATGEAVSLDITDNDASLDFQLRYDGSGTYASKIDLSTDTVIDITDIGIYDASGDGNGNLITSATDGDTVYLRVTVTDPFGEEDITGLDLVISDPSGSITNVSLDENDDVDVTSSDNTRIYEYAWSPTGNLGDYTIDVTANEGYEGTVTDTDSTTLRLQDTIAPDVIIGDASQTEGSKLVFNVSLLGGDTPTSDIVLDLAASTETGNTATEISDYEKTNFEYSIDGGTTWIAAGGTNGTQVTIPAGNTGIKVRIDSTADTSDEPNETFTLGVDSVVSGSIGDTSDTGTGTIIDDDATPTISIDDVSLIEGNSNKKQFNFTVSLSNPSAQTITVEYDTANGTATAGSDYDAATNQTVTFAPGETEKTITVLVTGETAVESNENFTVDLSNPTNATIDDASGTGTILNDDSVALLSINNVSITEGNSGTKTLNFTVTRSGITTSAVTVDYATANNTATTGNNDYESLTGTLSFASGETSKTISVTINGDTPPEADETFYVNLFNASANATITDSQGIGTIINDDASGTISGNVSADTNNDDTADSPLSGVTIELLDENGNSIDSDSSTSGVQPTTTTTDSNGDYEFTNVTPGNYLIKETDPTGYTSVSDGDTTDDGDDTPTNTNTNNNLIPVTITANETDSGNNFVDEQTGTISGTVLADINNDDIGDSPLSGVTIELYNDGGATPIAITTTNSNGGYSFTNLAPGNYEVKETNLTDYTDVSDADGTGSNDINTIDVSLSPGEIDSGNDFVDERGLISGKVQADTDNNNVGDTPLANVTLTLKDNNGDVVDTTTTDANGDYSFTDLASGTYTVEQTNLGGYTDVHEEDSVNDGTDDTDLETSASNNDNILDVVLVGGEADTGNDFVDEAIPGSISGKVLADTNDDAIGDSPLAGVTVTLGGDATATTTTASDGSYSFTGLAAGNYTVTQTNLSGYDNVSDGDSVIDAGGNDGETNNGNPNDNILTVALATNEADTGNDFIDEAQLGSISGTVTADTNGDDIGDSNLSGVTLSLLDSNNNPILDTNGDAITTTTNASGAYTFSNLKPGTYKVVETDLSGYSSVKDEDSDDTDDANTNTNNNSLTVTLGAGENDTNNNFVDQQNGSISGTVKADTNGDTTGDINLGGVTLSLKNSGGNVVATSTTASNGTYSFTDVTPGDYTVVETDPSGYSSINDGDSTTDATADDAANSSITDNILAVTLLAGETDSGNDFVDRQNTATGTISGMVEADTNDDGNGDTPISGVTIKLFNADGTVEIDSTTTNGSGNYTFNNVTTGTSYQVKEINNAGYGDVKDIDTNNDNTIDVDLTSTNTSIGNDFVDALDASISGRIWSEVNPPNGVDDSESGVENLTVTLIGGGADGVIGTGNDDTTETTTTAGGGLYSFTGLNPGEQYQVTFPTSAVGYSGLTTKDSGSDDTIDSDANTTTGKTDVITLAANEDKTDVDAGLRTSTINVEGTNVSETLSGGSGDETIAGYKGQDTLTGGGGSDTYFFNETSEGVDVITDFNDAGSDKVDLRQILANEVPAANSTNLFTDGYVLFNQYDSLGTMVQVDFDGSAGSGFPKSVVLLQGDDVGDLNTTSTTGNSDFIFF
jgi:hypothetical protein